MAATSAVAEVLHDAGHSTVACRGQEQPCLDRVAAEAAECHVEDVDGRQAGVERLEPGSERLVARCGERRAPEGIEVGRLVALGLVGTELGEGLIELDHEALRSPALVRDVLGHSPGIGHDREGGVRASGRRE